jgi:Predicted membrane protein
LLLDADFIAGSQLPNARRFYSPFIQNKKMSVENFFSEEEKKQITDAIAQAEHNTSGEIRLHVEGNCKIDVLDRAAYVFGKLDMQKTKQRNGVLFYLAVYDRKFAILGDAGINKVVPENFWDKIKETILTFFKQGKFAEGLSQGILMAGEQLKANFPYQSNDVNELPDEISFEKNL